MADGSYLGMPVEQRPAGGPRLECIDGPQGCVGPVELRWPGSGTRLWPRCERHGEERLEREEDLSGRYPTLQPSDFDELDAGERWEATP